MSIANRQIADRLEEAARLMRDQGADRFRVRAYARAATVVRHWPQPMGDLFRQCGLEGLEQLPGVGTGIARAIRELVTRGRLPMLDRLRGEADPVAVLASVPGIGSRLADRLHEELGINTLEQLEAAAHDGRLTTIAGFGEKRLAGIKDSLGYRLGRVRAAPVTAPGLLCRPGLRTDGDVRSTASVTPPGLLRRPGLRTSSPRRRLAPHADPALPTVSELLDVDREYREKTRRGELPLIAPRRFNPTGEKWLPVLHTRRGPRPYTALFSNTARAHQAGKTRDWVVIYSDAPGAESQYTVITASRGALRGQRVVAGREGECVGSQRSAA